MPATSSSVRRPAKVYKATKLAATPLPRKSKLVKLDFKTPRYVLDYAALVAAYEPAPNPPDNSSNSESSEPSDLTDSDTPSSCSADDEDIKAAAEFLLFSADPTAFTSPPPPLNKPKRKAKSRKEMDTYNERRKDIRHWKRLGIFEQVRRDEKAGIPGPPRPTTVQKTAPQHIVPAHSLPVPVEHAATESKDKRRLLTVGVWMVVTEPGNGTSRLAAGPIGVKELDPKRIIKGANQEDLVEV